MIETQGQVQTNSVMDMDAREGSYLGGVSLGFELAARLISAPNHHAMTCTLLTIVEQFPGIIDASCYEVFSKASDTESSSKSSVNSDDELLFRRFPLTLDDNYKDENTNILGSLLLENNNPVRQIRYQDKSIILLRVDEVIPRRVVFIEGALSDHYFAILKGLYSVYARQTQLLDTKERDSLTHLLNRQSLDQTLAQVRSYYRANPEKNAQGLASWLAVLDIDNFKAVNDTYGHIFGDEVLIHFSNILQEQMRFSDFLFRFGGEEFIVILNQVNRDGAKVAFERLRRSVEQYNFPSGQVTVSIGCGFIDCGKASEVILEEADKAVYAAKSAGRNRVVFFDEMVQSVPSASATGDVELF